MSERAYAKIAGIEIVGSPYCPRYSFAGYPDWRQRLARNLARPSLGKWEPLHRDVPNAFLINGRLYTHPANVVGLILND